MMKVLSSQQPIMVMTSLFVAVAEVLALIYRLRRRRLGM